MKAKIRADGAPTIHRDGTVSYWSVYRQQWTREDRDRIEDRERAAMPEHERRRIWGGWYTVASWGGVFHGSPATGCRSRWP